MILKGYFAVKQIYQEQDFKTSKFHLSCTYYRATPKIARKLLFLKETFWWSDNQEIGDYI